MMQLDVANFTTGLVVRGKCKINLQVYNIAFQLPLLGFSMPKKSKTQPR